MNDFDFYTPPTTDGLIKEMKEIKKENIEEFIFMFQTFYEAYRLSIRSFGFNNVLTKNICEKFKSFYSILLQEKKYINHLLCNIDSYNLNAVDKLLDTLDYVNETTYDYYDDYFNRAYFASCMNEQGLLFDTKHDKTLIETDDYSYMIAGLSLNDSSIRTFLSYSEDFWNYLNKITSFVDIDATGAKSMCGIIPIYDEEKKLSTFRAYIPIVVDLETALIVLDLYTKAYEYYKNIGKSFDGIEVIDERKSFIDTLDISKLKLKR